MIGRRKNNIIAILQENINPTNEYQKETINTIQSISKYYIELQKILFMLFGQYSTFYTIHNLLDYKMNIDILLFDRNIYKSILITEEYYND